MCIRDRSYNASGKFSRAITFDGSNDYLYNYNDYISAPDYRYKQITISLWVNLHTLPTGSNLESFISQDMMVTTLWQLTVMVIPFSEDIFTALVETSGPLERLR